MGSEFWFIVCSKLVTAVATLGAIWWVGPGANRLGSTDVRAGVLARAVALAALAIQVVALLLPPSRLMYAVMFAGALMLAVVEWVSDVSRARSRHEGE